MKYHMCIRGDNMNKYLYQHYLTEPNNLTMDEMHIIHRQLIESLGSDQTANELYNDLLETSIKYADYRAKWCLWTSEQKAANDASRSRCHDALIDQFNILSRYINSIDQSTTWRDMLGNAITDPYMRKRIGDFACYLALISSLHAR